MPAAAFTRFLEGLQQHSLLSAVQREQLPDLQQRYPDARALAHVLRRRGWLSTYQINRIAQGRAGELILGAYTLVEPLGEGGMGKVFKARQRSLERIVALKVIRPECLANERVIRRFQREIRAASQLAHPNVVHAYDADQIDGTYYIAMEYVDGIDLARLVKQAGLLPVWLACDLIRQAALGLQHAFERGLIHRDIKPANLLVAGMSSADAVASASSKGAGVAPFRPVVKITDFGLARWAEDEPNRPTTQLTKLGSVLGTAEFISPEQTRNSSTCDIRSDLYSLGCTFYYVLAGEVPFPTGTLTDKLLQHQLDTPAAIEPTRRGRLAPAAADATVPATVQRVVDRLLAKQAQDRYQTPAELADVLASIQQSLSPAAIPVVRRAPQPEPLAVFESTPEQGPVGKHERRVLAAVPVAQPVAAEAAPTARHAEPMLARRRVGPWFLGMGLALPLVVGLAAGLVLLPNRSPSTQRTEKREPGVTEPADATQWKAMLFKAQKKPTTAVLRHDLLAYRTQFPGSPNVRAADEWLARLPSSFDALDRVMLPRVPLVTIQSPPEMVGVLGEHRGYFSQPASLVAVSPDGRWLIGAEEPALRVWETADLAHAPARLQPQGQHLRAAVFAPDGKRLVTAGDGSAVRLWDPATRACVLTLDRHQAPVAAIAFRRDGSLLATARAGGPIDLWDPATGAEVGKLVTGPGDIQTLAFSPDGTTLFWNTGTQVRWADLTLGASDANHLDTSGAVRVLAFAPDGQTLLCGGGKGTVLVCGWDGRTLTQRSTIQHQVIVNKSKHTLQVNQAAFTLDGKTFATASSDHRVRIWDARTLTLQKEWDLHCPVLAVAFAHDGRHLITGNGNSTLTIFRLAPYTAEAAK